MSVDAVLAHLWQSTLFAGAIALVALAFRRAPAQTRYWIWFGASIKFAIPFAVLTSLGTRFQWRDALPAPPVEWTLAIEAVTLPLLAPHAALTLPRVVEPGSVQIVTVAAALWLLGGAAILAVWILRWQRVSKVVRGGVTLTSGRVFEALNRLAAPTALPIVASDTSLEPGVFGILRPVLLWPREIDTRLDEAQVRAILAHELAHVRRRDNLTGVVHMLIEVIFWFHPLVWWIGSRLVDERERACDEEVVGRGSDPHVYAESILRTCQFYVESPLSCVPGVTGSDLKKRIERIMTDCPRISSGTWPVTLLLTAAGMTLAAPVAVGALSAPVLPSAIASRGGEGPAFQFASITPNATGAMRVTMRVLTGGTWEATNVTLESMIRMSYRLQESQLVGGPDWIYNDRFDIIATSAGANVSDFALRMQSLLAERFNVRVHKETRELPIYALVTARRNGSLGPRLTPAAVDCATPAPRHDGPAPTLTRQPGERPRCGTIVGMGTLTGGGVTPQQIAMTLSQLTGRTVVDRTGLTGGFDYDLEFAPNSAVRGRGPGGGLPQGPAPEASGRSDAEGVSIFTAVQEQLGLRLDAQHGPVAVVVVDAADRPRDN